MQRVVQPLQIAHRDYGTGTVAAYDACKREVSGSGFMTRLEQLASGGGDKTTAKYAQRVLDRVNAPGRK